jgi:hypothetical protein
MGSRNHNSEQGSAADYTGQITTGGFSVDLADVICSLREELERAIAAGDGHALRFELGPVELEVSILIEAGAQAGVKARFIVVEVGAGGSADRTSTQRVKLMLEPRLASGGTKPLVTGAAVEGER